jgi:hypothetical protein
MCNAGGSCQKSVVTLDVTIINYYLPTLLLAVYMRNIHTHLGRSTGCIVLSLHGSSVRTQCSDQSHHYHQLHHRVCRPITIELSSRCRLIKLNRIPKHPQFTNITSTPSPATMLQFQRRRRQPRLRLQERRSEARMRDEGGQGARGTWRT